MKIVTPACYREFRCIAGACEDTCCAGWDVDVDAASYAAYCRETGKIGKKLQQVMVPAEDGGCTFTLEADGRCPFLNDRKLCDLYTALGEEALCETCTMFPRFQHEYGRTREIGLAPSCRTAAELLLRQTGQAHFTSEEDGKMLTGYNDIDPMRFLGLQQMRKEVFVLLVRENQPLPVRCLQLMHLAETWQKQLSAGRALRMPAQLPEDGNASGRKQDIQIVQETGEDWNRVREWLEPFAGMEVINPDWNHYLDWNRDFMERYRQPEDWIRIHRAFSEEEQRHEAEYTQLLNYAVFRYFLEAVYDKKLKLRIKYALIGYLVIRHLNLVVWERTRRSLTMEEQVDVVHLYSRQFEHSYVNFSWYTRAFAHRSCYSWAALRTHLQLAEKTGQDQEGSCRRKS